VPSLRLHKASGQAYVVLSGKAFYCGKPDDPATEQRYHKALAEWMAAGRQLPAEPNTITVKELLARFWTHLRNDTPNCLTKSPPSLTDRRTSPNSVPPNA